MVRQNCINKNCKDQYAGKCHAGKYTPVTCVNRITVRRYTSKPVIKRWCIAIVDKENKFKGFLLRPTKASLNMRIEYLNNSKGYNGLGIMFKFRTTF